MLTRCNRSCILDESCAELAPTAISYHKYSAMPMDNSGDQLVVRRTSGESIRELPKREPVVVFNKSLKDQVENTIWIKRHLHPNPSLGSTFVTVRVVGLATPQKDENPRLVESWDASPKQPSPKCCSIPSLR